MDLTSDREVDRDACRNCGSHVTSRFRATFGDGDNVAHRCLACDSRARIQRGSAAGHSVAYPDPADQEGRNRGPRTHATDGGVVGGDGR